MTAMLEELPTKLTSTSLFDIELEEILATVPPEEEEEPEPEPDPLPIPG